MAERLDPELIRLLREESETLYEAEHLLAPAVGRPNLRPQHVIHLTESEEATLREEASRRDISENELVREWVVAHLS